MNLFQVKKNKKIEKNVWLSQDSYLGSLGKGIYTTKNQGLFSMV